MRIKNTVDISPSFLLAMNSGLAPPATTADEAEAILEQHFKATSR